MFEPEFYKTRMGMQYYEKTLPSLAEEIAKLHAAVDSLNATLATFRPKGLPDGTTDVDPAGPVQAE